MATEPRMTIPTQLVLEALLQDPDRELYGVEIGELATLRSGTVHPILARLEGVGWLTSRWEEIDPQVDGRPALPGLRGLREGEAAATPLAGRRERLTVPVPSVRRSHVLHRDPHPLAFVPLPRRPHALLADD